MRQPLLLGLLLLATCAAAPQHPPTPVLALVNGRVYASPDAAPLDNGVVLVHAGTIAQVGNRSAVGVPSGATIIDCEGAVVTAGYQNSHVHFTEQTWAGAAGQPATKLAEQLQAMLTRYGFTTVVDTGSFLGDTTAIRRRIEAGEMRGPRILTAGIPLYPHDGIPYYVRESLPPDLLKLLHQPSSPAEAIAAVIENLQGDADIIKLFTGSWVTNQRVLPMPVDIARAAVGEANRRGKLVFSHASSVAGLEVALSAGVNVIAHALDDTRGLTADHLRRMKEHDVALVPTLTLFRGDAEVVAEVADYQKLGGQILFGTDVGYHTVYDPTREYEFLGKAGLTWRQVLASLTTNPAARFSEATRRGEIAPGMVADIVILARDPANDIRAFADVRQTIHDGRVIYSRAGTTKR
jgi:imidazolonepropionase-like amidohydrolase